MQEAILCSQTYSTHSSFFRQEGPELLKKHFILQKYYERLLVLYRLNISFIYFVLSLYKLKNILIFLILTQNKGTFPKKDYLSW